jgi:hypothetical protein
VARLTCKVANVDCAAVLICAGFKPKEYLCGRGDERLVAFDNSPEFQRARRNFRKLDMTAGAYMDVRNLLLDMFKDRIAYDAVLLTRAAQKDAA